MPDVDISRPVKSESAFRTISEAADELDVPQHVLRFWETKFAQIRPLKRGGGRRYYRPEDIALLHRIRGFLYDDGFTIKGVQKLLKVTSGRVSEVTRHEKDTECFSEAEPLVVSHSPLTSEIKGTQISGNIRATLVDILADLDKVRGLLRDVL